MPAIKDIMLPADLKRANAEVLVARAEGQAALERARGEAAALRSLANAARLRISVRTGAGRGPALASYASGTSKRARGSREHRWI